MPEGKTKQRRRALEHALSKSSDRERLLRDLTHKAIGDDGSVDAFVMLLQLVREALPSEVTLDADTLLYHAQAYAFGTSVHYLDAFMDYQGRMKAMLAGRLRE
jgi:hypothetical protein